MKIIDTHCHLDFDAYAKDRDEVLSRARENGLCAFVVPAVKMSTWDSLLSFCNQHDDIYYALGLHPMFIESHCQTHVESLRRYVQSSQPVAIGEIGLDFFDRSRSIEKQHEIFKQQLIVAGEMDLPVILHVRKAHEEVLACLAKYPVKGGVAHAFNGSLQQAERYMQYGFKFGFGGMLTYERSSKLRLLAKQLPITSIVLETDSPDMTVQAHRGERNNPEYIIDCLQALADVREMKVEDVARYTTNNAHELFAPIKV